MANLINEIGIFVPDNLINDANVPLITKSVKIKKGAKMKRGTVLGLLTAGGYGVAADSAKSDGSQTADCILADDVDATDGDCFVPAYSSGAFNRQALIFGGADTAEKHETKLRELGIFLKDNIK